MPQIIVEPMGGAIRRAGEDDTALGRRDVTWCYHALAMWMEPDQETADAHMAWARGLADDIRPHTTTGVYLNFTSDEGEDRVRSTYGPEKYDRLVALKDRYDPDNLFRLNQNIPPSGRNRRFDSPALELRVSEDQVGEGVSQLGAARPARVEAACVRLDVVLAQPE